MAKETFVEITINVNGDVEMDLQGFSGKQCDGVIDDLVDALGDEKTSVKKKEYYEKQKTVLKDRLRS